MNKIDIKLQQIEDSYNMDNEITPTQLETFNNLCEYIEFGEIVTPDGKKLDITVFMLYYKNHEPLCIDYAYGTYKSLDEVKICCKHILIAAFKRLGLL